MPLTNKLSPAWALAISAIVVGAAGFAALHWRAGQREVGASQDFIDPPAGPPAPSHNAFGVELGRTTFDDVARLTKKLGLACRDTSPRALVATAEKKAAEGSDVDAISAASPKRSPESMNPQVRYSCEATPSSILLDRARVSSTGRLLFVFDGKDQPLRHVSFRRQHASADEAQEDFQTTVDAIAKSFGQPHETKNPIVDAATDTFAPYVKHTAIWRYPTLKVIVDAMRFGANKPVGVYEAYEVPWPVRADAPTSLRSDPKAR